MGRIITKDMLTTNQRETYEFNADMIKYYRENPVRASMDLLGFKPLDYQAYMIQRTWVSQYAVWCVTRNGAKSLIGGTYMALNNLLFEGVKIYIISSVGAQAKDTFRYIENIATDNIPSVKGLKGIFYDEMLRQNDKSVTGFSHDPASFSLTMLNGGFTRTLNSIADNTRGKRADIVFFDECGFMDEEQIVVAEAFTTTDTTFTTSVEEFFNPYIIREKRPAQIIYASSASDKTTYFYQKYKEFAKRMWAGDKKFFVVDINVDVPLNPTMNGKPYPPLLDRSKPETALATNPSKAMREYYNKFDEDGGDDQIVKGHTILRNSTFLLPELVPEKGSKYVLIYDPASMADNSVLGIGKICHDDKRGIYGKMVNMLNFKDLADLKGNRQMMYPEQIDELRHYISLYNGDGVEYENIHKVSVDAGSGGGGHLYSHTLMYDWKDSLGEEHRGVIDKEFYEDKLRDFQNAYPIMRMVEPKKWKSIMVGRLIDLMDLGLIEFPKEYTGSGHIDVEDESGELVRKYLSKEEILALSNLDICKEETKMIHRYKNGDGSISYKTRVDMQRKIHDDRFYVLALFANEIHELREKDTSQKAKKPKMKKRVGALVGNGTRK